MTDKATPAVLGFSDGLGPLVDGLRHAAARKWAHQGDRKHSLFGAAATAIELKDAALLRQVENIERWLRTGKPASADESQSIYEQMCLALERDPQDVHRLTDEELAYCGLLSEFDE